MNKSQKQSRQVRKNPKRQLQLRRERGRKQWTPRHRKRTRRGGAYHAGWIWHSCPRRKTSQPRTPCSPPSASWRTIAAILQKFLPFLLNYTNLSLARFRLKSCSIPPTLTVMTDDEKKGRGWDFSPVSFRVVLSNCQSNPTTWKINGQCSVLHITQIMAFYF